MCKYEANFNFVWITSQTRVGVSNIPIIEIRIKLILFCYETGEPKNDNLEVIHLEYQKANFMWSQCEYFAIKLCPF